MTLRHCLLRTSAVPASTEKQGACRIADPRHAPARLTSPLMQCQGWQHAVIDSLTRPARRCEDLLRNLWLHHVPVICHRWSAPVRRSSPIWLPTQARPYPVRRFLTRPTCLGLPLPHNQPRLGGWCRMAWMSKRDQFPFVADDRRCLLPFPTAVRSGCPIGPRNLPVTERTFNPASRD